MTLSERTSEYAARILAAPLAAVVAGGVATLALGLVSWALGLFGSAVLDFGSFVLSCLGRGFAFVFSGSIVLPRTWRVWGALVLVGVGTALQIYWTHSNTSDPEPPLWPLFVAVAGGLAAMAVLYFRRPAK